MSSRSQTAVVYLAGAAQGIVLVSFPAAGTVFTDPTQYGLSGTQYGLMFLPQVVTAILTSVYGGRLSRRWGIKSVYLAGLGGGLLAMALLLASLAFLPNRFTAYLVLLAATTCLGAGFGLTVPALNALTAAFHPTSVDTSVLVLNALLGVGTVLAPVFVAVFVSLGFWWGMPITAAAMLAALMAVSLRLPLRVERSGAEPGGTGRGGSRSFPHRYRLFVAFAVLYGLSETLNGNWSQVDVTSDLGASVVTASLALTAFWTMVTLGRVGFALAGRWLSTRQTFHLLPFVLAGAFVVISSLPSHVAWAAVAAFGLAGLGCSALLPLTISFAQDEFTAIASSVPGGIIASYQVGYGLAAFAVGPLLAVGISLSSVYRFAAVVAVAMGLLSFRVARAAA